MTRSELRGIVARAIWEADGGTPGEIADRAIAAVLSAIREPTPEMERAGADATQHGIGEHGACGIWQAMVSALADSMKETGR